MRYYYLAGLFLLHLNLTLHAQPLCKPQMAKEIKIISSRELKSGAQFVKAASGIAYAEGSLYIIQDSSRYLAKVSPVLDREIEFLKLAPLDRINELEDPSKPFEEFRRDRRADFEAITTLPDGRLLILASGYDARNIGTTKAHYRNLGVLFDPKTSQYIELNLEHFYHYLLGRADFVGKELRSTKPRLNIEGVGLIDGKLAFFHRSNFAKNDHDAMIIFELSPWLNEVSKKRKWQLNETSITRFDFGHVDWKGQKFPITLNDVAYVDGQLILPVACETDTIVNGKDVDGEVIWTGIAKVNIKDNSCTMLKFSDTKVPKIEGIAPDPKRKGRFYLVHDVDSETSPSLLSEIEIK